MGLFDGLDVSGAELPTAKPGTWPGFVSDVKIGPTKAGDKVGMTITFTYNEGENEGEGPKRTVLNWQHIPSSDDDSEDAKRSMGYLKMLLSNLGVPESRMNSVGKDDLLGTPVWVTVKEQSDSTFMRLQKVTVRDSDSEKTSSRTPVGLTSL